MDNSSRRDIMLKAGDLDEAIHRNLVVDIQRDIRERRYDSNQRLMRDWLITAGEEMERIERRGRNVFLLCGLSAACSLGLSGVVGQWLLGLVLVAVALVTIKLVHHRLSYLAMRIGRTQHLVSDFLSYGQPVDEYKGGSADEKLADYVKHQHILTIPQLDAMARHVEGGGA